MQDGPCAFFVSADYGAKTVITGVPFKKTKDGIMINVKVLPRSSRRGVEVVDDGIKVRLTAPPVGGEANEQLVEVLSESLGIKKGSFRIIRGLSSRNKIVEVKGVQVI